MNNNSEFSTWVLITSLVILILFQGLFAFLVVGDRGQPGWDYRTIRDVPGQSPYAFYRVLPYPQHVRGHNGE